MKLGIRQTVAGMISVAVILAGSSIAVRASVKQTMLQDYIVGEDTLNVICAVSEGDESCSASDFQISLGGQEITDKTVGTVKEEQLPTTYYCMVDASGSISDSQMAMSKEILTAISSQLQEGDNMVIATLGNQTDRSDFLSDSAKLQEAIDELGAISQGTNLYAGIVDSLQILQSNKDANPRQCLIILSDGEDDQKSGITKEEAETVITNSRVPVYTVALQSASSSSSSMEYAKLLGSFARMSAGGVHYVPQVDGIENAAVADDILNSMQNTLLLKLGVSDIQTDKDTLLLRVIYTAADGSSYEDSMDIYSEDLAVLQAEATEEVTEEVTEAATEDIPEEPEQTGGHRIVVILVVVGIVILAGVVVIILLVNKKKSAQKEAQEASEAEISGVAGEAEASDTHEMEEEAQPEAETVSGDGVSEQEIQRNVYELRLQAVGYETITYVLKLEEGRDYTIGRTRQSDIVLDENDKRLSGVHCKVRWENHTLYIWDMNSKNGSFVNGVPIQSLGRVAVHEGETLRIGSYEYRIG